MSWLSNKAWGSAVPGLSLFQCLLSFKLITRDVAHLTISRDTWWCGRGQAIGIRLGTPTLN